MGQVTSGEVILILQKFSSAPVTFKQNFQFEVFKNINSESHLDFPQT